MAVEKSRLRSGKHRFRAYWRNPATGKIERGPWTSEVRARRLDDETKIRLKYDRDSFTAPAQAKSVSASSMCVADLCYLYLRGREMTESSRHRTFYHLRTVISHLGEVPVDQLGKRELRAAESAMREGGSKQNTIQRRISIVKSAYGWALEQGILEGEGSYLSVLHHKCHRGPDQKFVPPTPEEAALIYEYAPEHVRRVVVLGYSLGSRVGPSELFALRWEHFRGEGPDEVVVYSAAKNKDLPYRIVGLRRDVRGLVRAWAARDEELGIPHVIHWRGRPVCSIKTAWSSTLKRAGLTRRIRPYDLRHAFATYALCGGADPGAVAAIMGHSSTAMVHRHYQHVLDSQRAKAVEAAPSLPIRGGDHGIQARDTKPGFSADFTYPATEKCQ